MVALALTDGLIYLCIIRVQWAAEMTEHCGIGTWQQNSRVIHATSVSLCSSYHAWLFWHNFSPIPAAAAYTWWRVHTKGRDVGGFLS